MLIYTDKELLKLQVIAEDYGIVDSGEKLDAAKLKLYCEMKELLISRLLKDDR